MPRVVDASSPTRRRGVLGDGPTTSPGKLDPPAIAQPQVVRAVAEPPTLSTHDTVANT
jgi:hypothetical protein